MTDIGELEHWHFELTEASCNALLRLVLEGRKRATSSSLEGYRIDGTPIPEAGNMSVITDWDGVPRCVIRTTRVRILPYREMTFELARLEGEDEDLASWQKSHTRFFTEEGEALGYRFSEEMDVVFEEFEVVRRLP